MIGFVNNSKQNKLNITRHKGYFSSGAGVDFPRILVAILGKCLTRKKYRIFIYGIWDFKKTALCSEGFVLSSRQEITRKRHYCGGKTLTQRAQKIISSIAFVKRTKANH